MSDGAVAGSLTRAAGRITFRYEDDWRRLPDATPLSVSMPLTARDHPARVVEPWLWGLLPDSEPVLARWAREFHTTTVHPLGLLARVGEDLPGSFQIVAPDQLDSLRTDGSVEWLSAKQVAGLLRDVRADPTAWLGRGAEGRWSLAGAQPKIALRREGKRWGRPHGRAATTHILKPAIEGLDDHDLNEHLCLRAGRLLGLRTVRTEIVSFGDERAIVVERYDRLTQPNGAMVRVHQEDMCQALSVPPELKYESDGGPTAADVATVLQDHIPGRAGQAAVSDFADALAFSWIIGAPDAHAKNFALLLAGRQVRMAPLYDIGSALPYPDSYEPKLKLAMKVGRKDLASRIGSDDWVDMAAALRLDADELLSRIRSMCETVSDALATVGADPAIAEIGSPLPAVLLDRVTIRAKRCAERLK
ncbi:MAG TPA: type II toxin-antitoxin system HipA family toxin [Mycobacteriales bacterium]|nr:type II toxin-antitoxin system HipA family toxin [Mycobacteriales bacterium]